MLNEMKSRSAIARIVPAVAAMLLGGSVCAQEADAEAAEDDSGIVEEIRRDRHPRQHAASRWSASETPTTSSTRSPPRTSVRFRIRTWPKPCSGSAASPSTARAGEGAFVSVRGLGPQFVATTIGGRVSASNVAPGSHDGRGNTNPKSRAVGFHGFQSGLVQAVEIHKSPRADHAPRAASAASSTFSRASPSISESGALHCPSTRRETSCRTIPHPAYLRSSATC